MRSLSLLLAIFLLVLAAACAGPAERPRGLRLDGYRILDLTHTFDERTLYWPTAKHFEHQRVAWGPAAGGYFYSSYDYGASEHGGTHLDAPVHFAEGAPGVADIPIQRLIGPAVVIDISAQCQQDRDYLLSLGDIQNHESGHGAIPKDSIVLVRTGWDQYWPDALRYLGSDQPGDTENLHFPGISPEAAMLLRDRGVSVVGIDTASIDHGPSRDFRTHQVLAAAQIVGLENVARLAELPPAGALVFALPMKIAEGSGAPCRIVALLPRD